jgi:hypothetical protein
MAKVRYVDNKPTLDNDSDDGKLRIFGKTLEEMRQSRRSTGENFPSKFKKKSPMSADGIDRELEGRPANPDFPGKLGISPSDKIGPKFNTPKKVTKKEITVEGDYGSVDRDNPDVMGPDMGKINKAAAEIADIDMQEKARRSMGFKRGGKTKCMSSGGKASSASRRADGCAIRGKTKGRMV